MNTGLPSKVCSVDDALAGIRDGATVTSTGVIGWLTPDALFRGLADHFHAGRGPRDLSFFFPVAVGDAMDIPGMDRVALPGLMKRIVCGNYINPVHPVTGERPAVMRMIRDNQVEAHAWPIGATMHWLREVARRGPGYLTQVGLGTFIDPRQEGGRLNARTEQALVQLREFDGHEYLFYPTWSLDVAFIRATSADDAGNLSFEDEPLHSAALAIALAVKACGGRVIAQVRRIVERSSRPAGLVNVPGALVDHVVVDPEPMMTTQVRFDARYLGGPFSRDGLAPVPAGADKIVARRAARELREGEVAIFGFGASSDIPLVMAEQGLFDNGGIHRWPHTTEHGTFGGVVMSGWQFSANLYPEALVDGLYQFDFIDGGNCPFAALAFAQLDEHGRVNVSKFGPYNPGSGGFIDIAANARRLVFTGTFTTGGLVVETSGGRLRVVKEGRTRKFVRSVEQVTYPARDGVRRHGQQALVITERAVFSLEADGLVLREIAPGIDLQREVLDLMDYPPVRIADDLQTMDASLFA